MNVEAGHAAGARGVRRDAGDDADGSPGVAALWARAGALPACGRTSGRRRLSAPRPTERDARHRVAAERTAPAPLSACGRYTCVAWPKNTSADSIIVSVSVGCGWIVSFRSVAFAPISIASTPSAISSPAPGPTRPTPRMRSVFGIENQLGHAVRAVEGDGAARGAPGEPGDHDLASFFLRLRLGQAGPGQLRIGEDHGRNRLRLRTRRSRRRSPRRRRALRATPCAPASARRRRRRSRKSTARRCAAARRRR